MKKLLAFVLAAGLACHRGPTDVDIGEIALLIVSGDGQSGPFNTELPDPLVVKVTKPNGNPLKNQIVNFVVVEGGGSVFAGVAQTNTRGLAQEFWTLGAPGPQTLEVRAVDPATGEKIVFGTFTATALGPVGQGVADNIECFDLQSGTFKLNGSCNWGTRSPNETVPVKFRTVLNDGTPVADVTVALQIDPTCLGTCNNAGSVTPTEVISDARGVVNASWTLGPNSESNRLTVSINDGGIGIGVSINAPPAAVVDQVRIVQGTSSLLAFASQTVVARFLLQGSPVANLPFRATVQIGLGTVAPRSGFTDANGEALVLWTFGPAGGQRLLIDHLTTTGASIGASTPGADPPTQNTRFVQCLDLVDGQWKFSGSCGFGEHLAGSTFQVTFRTLDADAATIVPFAAMLFRVDPLCLGTCNNPGSVTPTEGFTDANGEISVAWTLGPAMESNRLEALIAPEAYGGVGVWVGGN